MIDLFEKVNLEREIKRLETMQEGLYWIGHTAELLETQLHKLKASNEGQRFSEAIYFMAKQARDLQNAVSELPERADTELEDLTDKLWRMKDGRSS